MAPILFRFTVGGAEVAVGAYSTFMTLAWTAVLVVGVIVAAWRGLGVRRTATVLAVALAASLLGGRMLDLYVAAGVYADDPSLAAALSFQGFSLYGALIAGSLAAVWTARLIRLPVWPLADAAVPGLAIGIALMRVGCYLRGCCFGVPTDLPWGVTFPPGSPAWAQQVTSGALDVFGAITGQIMAVHPTQLYELAAALLLGAAATALMCSGRVPDGVPFLAFAIGFTLFRLGDWYLRAPVNGAAAPAWFYPALYVSIAAGLAGVVWWRFAAARAVDSRSADLASPSIVCR